MLKVHNGNFNGHFILNRKMEKLEHLQLLSQDGIEPKKEISKRVLEG